MGRFTLLCGTPDQEQTITYSSSSDLWHEPSDLGSTRQAQLGFDLFFTSGVTQNLPAVIPVAMLYDTPENAAAEMAYIKKRNYPVAYVELGEEADGQFTVPEDYAELYIQAARAIHRVDPSAKLGGPSFTGENQDIFAGLWLADYVGSFLNSGGKGLYYFHYLPLQMEHGCNDSPGTFGMFTLNKDYQVQQYLSQYFASQLINLDWIKPGNGEHRVFSAKGDINDGAGRALLTAYALDRPDADWSLLIVNRDQFAPHQFRINFHDDTTHNVKSFTGSVSISTFGSEQYKWHPASTVFMAH